MNDRVSVYIYSYLRLYTSLSCKGTHQAECATVVVLLPVIVHSFSIMTMLSVVVSGCCEAFRSLMCVLEWCGVKGEA